MDDDNKEFESVLKVTKSPTGTQRTRLHELISEHAEILSSSADDEPLKSRIWLNIAEELNKQSKNGPFLTPKAWQKFVDWHKYTVRRGRKPKRSTTIDSTLHAKCSPKNMEIVKFDIVSETYLEPKPAETFAIKKLLFDHSHLDENIKNNKPEDKVGGLNNDVKVSLSNDIYIENNVIFSSNLMNENDNTGIAAPYRNVKKNLNLTPIVRSFTYSQRIVKCVEKLGNGVSQIQKKLKETVNNVKKLERTMQKQIIQHHRTNVLLKRNARLFKILTQRKYAYHTKT